MIVFVMITYFPDEIYAVHKRLDGHEKLLQEKTKDLPGNKHP